MIQIHLQPVVNLRRLDSVDEGVVDLQLSVLEPERKEPQRVLEGATVRQGDRVEESLHSSYTVSL